MNTSADDDLPASFLSFRKHHLEAGSSPAGIAKAMLLTPNSVWKEWKEAGLVVGVSLSTKGKQAFGLT